MSLLLEKILQEYETVIVEDKHVSISHTPRVLLYLHQFQTKSLTTFLSSDIEKNDSFNLFLITISSLVS